MTRHTKLTMFLITAMLLTSCSKLSFTYAIWVANYGEKGIAIQRVAPYITGGQLPKNRTFLPINLQHKGLPGTRDSRVFLGQFEDYKYSLPEEIHLAWNPVDLIDCNLVRPEQHLKLGCTFDKFWPIQVKTINLKEHMDNPVIKQAGSPVKGGTGVYGVNLIFEFRDEKVELIIEEYQTNPWR